MTAGVAARIADSVSVAILIPCYNEEVAIPKVIADFHAVLPRARIFVYDNNSSDKTAIVAARAGAIVCHESQQGKGNVVRRMFADVEADVYLLVDGDDTYEAAAAPGLIELLVTKQLDLVNAARVASRNDSYRPGHRFGNLFLTWVVSSMFGRGFDDMLSGFRAFSRRFVKSFPALTEGFEIETELTVHALELRLPVAEVRTAYKERPEGSTSKLRTFRDGFRILGVIVRLIKSERPLQFFSLIAGGLVILAGMLAVPIVLTYLETALVPRFPTAVLIVGLVTLSALSLVCGLILDTVTRGRRELRRLAYLQLQPVRLP